MWWVCAYVCPRSSQVRQLSMIDIHWYCWNFTIDYDSWWSGSIVVSFHCSVFIARWGEVTALSLCTSHTRVIQSYSVWCSFADNDKLVCTTEVWNQLHNMNIGTMDILYECWSCSSANYGKWVDLRTRIPVRERWGVFYILGCSFVHLNTVSCWRTAYMRTKQYYSLGRFCCSPCRNWSKRCRNTCLTNTNMFFLIVIARWLLNCVCAFAFLTGVTTRGSCWCCVLQCSGAGYPPFISSPRWTCRSLCRVARTSVSASELTVWNVCLSFVY